MVHGNISCPPVLFSPHSQLFSPLSSSNDLQPTMSFDHFFQYPSSNDTDADAMNAEQRRGRRDLFITPIPMFTPDPTFAPDTFFAPDPQLADAPSPETFDLEVDNNKEVEGFDLESSLRQFDDLFATFRDTVPVVPTPSVVTYSTESTYDVSSQYSCDLTLSDYSIPSDIGSRGSVSDSFSPPTSFYSATFSDFSPSIPPLSPSKAVTGQESAAVSPSAAVHVALDETQGPMPFKCTYPQCSFCESEIRDFISYWLTLLASLRT